MAIELVIFDFDGVLVDSEYIAGQTMAENLKNYDCDMGLDIVLKDFVGMHDQDMLHQLSIYIGADRVEQFMLETKKLTLEAYKARLKVIKDVELVLNEINIPICIASNSRLTSLNSKLKITKLNKYFDADKLFVGAMVAKPKPAPDIFLHAAKYNKVDTNNCLVVEDSVPGTIAAIAAGMNVVGFHGASHCYDGYENKLLAANAQLTFNQMKQLPDIIKQFAH